jgi:hypothetical protein
VPSAIRGLVTEPLLTVEIGRGEFQFVVDTGATVLLIKPTVSEARVRQSRLQARGVSGTNLDILGVQEVKFTIGFPKRSMTFIHSFMVCPLEICSAGILGLDFLQRVGAEISLTDNLLTLRNRQFSLSSAGPLANIASDPEVLHESTRGPITHESEEALDPTDGWEEDESCIGTVELAEAVSVPPLSGRIARGRVVRRDDLTEFKAPPNQVIMVDPEIWLPGIYIARIVATLRNDENNEISSEVHGSPRWSEVPLGSMDAEQINSPSRKIGNLITSQEKAGSGESQPELPPNSLRRIAVNSLQGVAIGLQEQEERFLPVGNGYGNHTDTGIQNSGRKGTREKHTRESWNKGSRKGGSKIIGYVPIQIVNLSLEEIQLSKRMYVGTASPTETCVGIETKDEEKLAKVQDVLGIKHMGDKNKGRDEIGRDPYDDVNNMKYGDKRRSEIVFDLYLNEKLGHLTEQDRNKLEPILKKYSHIFYQEGSSAIGCTSTVKHKINTGDAQPIKKTPYRIPHALKPVVEEHVEDMLKKGIIEPSISPWSSSIVLVKKKTTDGSVKYRFCVDYRSLNAVTKPDAYPIPNIVDTLDSLGTSKIFSVLDMASGYHQIEIQEEDREKTAFSCHMGHYQFTKLPFGVNNGPATYQRCMDFILTGLKGIDCLAYLDDLICYSATMEEHAEKLARIFKRLEQANFKIQPSKCVFATDTVEYLGHIVTKEGVKPDPRKIQAVKEYPTPRTVRDVRAFIGLAGYYRRHVRNFAEIAKPLTNLTKKDVPFEWGPEQEKAFLELKDMLSQEPLLIYPDFSQPFIVACDASTKAVGAILSQIKDGEERPVAYCSRQLNSAETKYSITELELLALIFAVKQFRCYLYGRQLKCIRITEH